MTPVEMIAHQERTLVFDRFDEETAWSLGSWIADRGRAARAPIVIDIRLFHRPLFFAALPGSVPDNAEWARRKRNVVERYHRSSYGVGLDMAAKGSSLLERYGLPLLDFAAHGGAFPITLAGCGVIGCIAVSGLPQIDDHMLVVRSVYAATGKDPDAFEIDR
ncbi:heme-degrading domain-containing protein [Sphingomonas sp. CFBP 13603]|uniref:heme-degrading domain-containing protein n=1 Tax=Sphingomonas sp. CFBP 13603 TaxID=2774040 RepID=UPI0018694A31|nr:heme-degrading domain-containing protein [Sphingomonas sp. CFBP 13603]MBE2990403.1 heme-degrading domain-containing protein [Sphingomonas sp. CFBP 13603]